MNKTEFNFTTELLRITNSLSSLAKNGKVKSIELVGSSEKVVWTQKKKTLQIQPSKKYPTGMTVVYNIMIPEN